MSNLQSLLETAKTSVDPEERSKAAKELSRLDRIEREKRAQDQIMIHNILEDEYVVRWDIGGQNLAYRIPGRTVDVGEGKGNKTVPRFIAEKALTEIITKQLTELADHQAAKLKKEYSGDWAAGYVEQRVLRTNNPQKWEEHAKDIWLGVVKVYGDEYVENAEETIVENNKVQEDVVKKLGLDTLVYKEKQKQLIEEVEHGSQL